MSEQYRCFCGYSQQQLYKIFGALMWHIKDGHILQCPECLYMSYHVMLAHGICINCGFQHGTPASGEQEEEFVVLGNFDEEEDHNRPTVSFEGWQEET